MGSFTLRTCLVAALCASLCDAAPVSENLVVSVSPSVSVHRGQTTTLPCWLSPPQDAEGLEVRWYRDDHYDSPVMLYMKRHFEHKSQEASFVDRVSFGLKDAASGGLKAGDVSLKLLNAELEDAGYYTCYVSSDQGYDSGNVKLSVTNTGTLPLLSPVWREDNKVNVSCESEGWYPEPSVRWSDQKQVVSPKGLKYSNDTSGLVSVHSWLLVSSSSEVSCSVGLPDEEAKEAKLRLNNAPQPEKLESGSSAAGWVAFALLLIAMLAVLGVLYYRKRGKKTEKTNQTGEAEEHQELLPEEKIPEAIQPTDLSTAIEHYVNVTLDKTENKYLTAKDHLVRDANVHFPDGGKVTCLTAIRGTPGFSSGQHYWEVSLGNPNIAPKQSWWIGVTGAAVIPQEVDFSPTASNGFWFLSSSPDRAAHFQFSTKPRVLLPFSSRPQTVGVYLNYNSGELSFYDVEGNRLIGSFSAKFTGEVFPFFNPGKGDKGSMMILQEKIEQHQPEQNQPEEGQLEHSQSNDVEKAVESTTGN